MKNTKEHLNERFSTEVLDEFQQLQEQIKAKDKEVERLRAIKTQHNSASTVTAQQVYPQYATGGTEVNSGPPRPTPSSVIINELQAQLKQQKGNEARKDEQAAQDKIKVDTMVRNEFQLGKQKIIARCEAKTADIKAQAESEVRIQAHRYAQSIAEEKLQDAKKKLKAKHLLISK